MENGQSVRLRTSKHQELVINVKGEVGSERFGIEGCEWLLISMPKVRCRPGTAIAYLVPTKEVIRAARAGYWLWQIENPLKPDCRPRRLWFTDNHWSKASSGFHHKWSEYRLPGAAPFEAPGDATEAELLAAWNGADWPRVVDTSREGSVAFRTEELVEPLAVWTD